MSELVAHRPPAGRLGRSKGDSPDTGGSAPGVVCRRMHISIPGNWASNNPVFAISHGSCTAAPSTPSQRSMRSRHAVVPSRFPVQVRRVTQRPPPSEPLPSVRVIQRRVRRRNFALWTGFPALGLLRGLRPAPAHQSATDLPTTAPAAAVGGRPGTVPTFTMHRSIGEAPSSTPAASPRLRRRPSPWPPHRQPKPASELIRPPSLSEVMRCTPAHIRQVRAGSAITERRSLVPLVRLLVSLAGPGPSGSSGTSRRCRGCSHPRRRLPGRASPSFTRPLRRPGGEVLPPLSIDAAPRGALDRHSG